MFSSSKNDTLYHSKVSDIRTIMFLKRLKRLEKGLPDFNCFVVDVDHNYKKIEDFLERLQKNIGQLQNKTRFQFAVFEKFRGHWYLVDCYIKNKKLYTFCMDASGFSKDKIQPSLYKYFPHGKHYSFVITDDAKIQNSNRDCQTFTREHAGIISNIDADKLYLTLETHETHSKYRTINLVQLAEIPIFTKLVRGIQSLRYFKNFKPTVQNTIVSSKGFTLAEWVNENTQHGKNVSIQRKDYKYSNILFASSHAQPPPHDKDRATGLVTFPIISQLLNKMEELSLLEIQVIVNEFISDLNQAPLYTQLFSFLHIPALHSYIVRQTIENLKEINNLCESKEEAGKSSMKKTKFFVPYLGDIITGLTSYSDHIYSLCSFLHIPALYTTPIIDQAIENLKEINSLCESKEETNGSSVAKQTFIVHRFGDIITGLAGYLDNHDSQRTLSIVNQFLLKLNEKFYDAEDYTKGSLRQSVSGTSFASRF